MNPSDAGFRFFPPIWLEEVSSTNDHLKELLAAGESVAAGMVVAARRQVRGKGRMGGVWQSSPKGDLTFSFYWRSDRPPVTVATLPMACALAVRDFLALPPWNIRTQCKWPNDVLANNAKICGILAEGGDTRSGGFGLVVGIGVNLRRVSGRDEAIGRRTATVEDHYPEVGDPFELLPILLDCLAVRIEIWERSGFEGIRGDLVDCLWGVGQNVTAKTTNGTVRGIVAGLAEGGELVLKGDDGTDTKVASVTALDGWEIPA